MYQLRPQPLEGYRSEAWNGVYKVHFDTADDFYRVIDLDDEIRVVTNSSMTFGAAAICDKAIQARICEDFGDTWWVLPSSIHEVLAVRKINDLTPEALFAMVCDINNDKRCMSADNFLANAVWEYRDGEIVEVMK